MTDPVRIRALLVDDDPDSLQLLVDALRGEDFAGYVVEWVPVQSFEEADTRLASERFDLVASDIYRDREGQPKDLESGDNAVQEIVARIRQHGFCPILVFSDGVLPELPRESAFVRRADKSEYAMLVEGVRDLLATRIPAIASQLHRDLEQYTGSYLWDFLEREWDRLGSELPPGAIERVVRRRAGLILGRFDSPGPDAQELPSVEAGEYYIYPSLAPGRLRLGEVLQDAETGSFQVVLTPHCDLVIQPGSETPRADTVLLATAIPADEILVGRDKAKSEKELRGKIGNPSNVGRPNGRYWFLPGFLDIPNLYCDFMRLTSVAYSDVFEGRSRVAVLDSPFAEALQVAFSSFYSRVGTGDLDPSRFTGLLTPPEE